VGRLTKAAVFLIAIAAVVYLVQQLSPYRYLVLAYLATDSCEKLAYESTYCEHAYQTKDLIETCADQYASQAGFETAMQCGAKEMIRGLQNLQKQFPQKLPAAEPPSDKDSQSEF
jgi:hypothetical protein